MVDTTMERRTKTLAEILAGSSAFERNSMCNLLLIGDFDPERRVFVREDGGVTAIAEVTPGPCSTIDDAELEDIASSSMSQAIQGLGHGAILQCTILPSKRIGDTIGGFQGYRRRRTIGMPEHAGKNRFLEAMSDSLVQQYENGTTTPLFSGGDFKFTIKTFRVILCITVLPSASVTAGAALGGFFASAGRSGPSALEKAMARIYHPLTQRVTESINRFARAFDRCGARTTLLDDVQYMGYVREILHPNTGHTYAVNTEVDRPIYERTPVLPVISDPANGQILSDGAIYRVCTMREMSGGTSTGMLSLPHKKLGGSSAIEMLGDGFITITAQVYGKHELDKIASKKFNSLDQGFVLGGRARRTNQELARLAEMIEEGRVMCRTEITACVRAQDDEAATAAAARVRERLTDAGFEMRQEQQMAPAMWLRAIPGNAFPPIESAGRDRLLLDWNIADMLPIYGRHRGTTEGMMLLANRAGEPSLLSPFGGASAHTFLAGKSGKGKSVFCAFMVACHLCLQGSQAFIVDKDRSSGRLCAAMGRDGQFINLAGRCRINPCEGTMRQAMRFLPKFLQGLACPNPEIPLPDDELAMLNTVITTVFADDAKQLRDVPFTDLDDLLETHKDKYLEWAFKRLECAYINPEQATRLEQRKKDDDDLESWRINYRYFLDGGPTDEGAHQSYERITQVGKQEVFLRSQGMQIEEEVVTRGEEEPRRSIVLYSSSPHEVDFLNQHGFTVALDTKRSFILAQGEDDVKLLQDAGVKFLVPQDLRDAAEAKARAEGETRGSSAEIIDLMVRSATEAVDGMAVYRATTGRAQFQIQVFMRDIAGRLRADAEDGGNQVARRLIERMAKYLPGGTAGAIFDGATSFDLTAARMFTFEQGSLSEEDAHKHHVVIAALVNKMTVHARDRRYRNRRKIFAIDEAWTLLRHPAIAQSLEMLWRTARKFNCACVYISQNLNDVDGSEIGKILRSLSPNRYVLNQDRTIARASTEFMGYTPMQAALLESVDTEPGQYSEIFVEAIDVKPRIDGEVFVFKPTAFLYWLFTTKGEDVQYLDSLQIEIANGGATDEDAFFQAIMLASERYPNGWRPT